MGGSVRASTSCNSEPLPCTGNLTTMPMNPLKLAIVSTHPIQYYAPVFRALSRSARVQPRVFFTWSQTENGPVFDPGFGIRFEWDIPLRDGYDHVFVHNVSKEPGTSHFRGIQNPTLNREIAAWGADALLVYGWRLHSHLAAMRHFKGRIPVLFRGDSTLLDTRTSWRALARKACLRWVYSHVDAVIAVGENNRDYYLWSGVSSQRITIAPHSVDTGRFQDADGQFTRRAAAWRADLGISADTPVVLFAAKFIPRKQPLLLIEAFERLQSSTAHLILVGNGEMEHALQDRARTMPNVHFLPFQNQTAMPVVYRLGDVYVLPSNNDETWGLALNEAMASGRAVIASSKVGGARDLIVPSRTGWIFESGNVEALSATLSRALTEGVEGLRRLGEDAQRRSALFSTEAAADAIEAAVVDAFNRHHSSSRQVA